MEIEMEIETESRIGNEDDEMVYIRSHTQEYIHSYRMLIDQKLQQKQYLSAMKTVKLALDKLVKAYDGESQQSLNYHIMTPLHAEYIKLCILAKRYTCALSILKYEIIDVETCKKYLDIKDILTYYYYGGMVYTALRQFQLASVWHKTVLCMPTNAPSAIVLEAYKKYILLCLLTHMEMSLPKFAHSMAMRNIHTLSSPYVEFYEVYRNQGSDFNALLMKYQQVYIADKNMGLIKQCIHALSQRKIIQLTKVYVTLSIKDITKEFQFNNSEETEQLLRYMIHRRYIYARINKKDGIVTFNDSNEEYDNKQALMQLREEISVAIAEHQLLTQFNRSLSLDPNYLRKLVMMERAADTEGQDVMEMA